MHAHVRALARARADVCIGDEISAGPVIARVLTGAKDRHISPLG